MLHLLLLVETTAAHLGAEEERERWVRLAGEERRRIGQEMGRTKNR